MGHWYTKQGKPCYEVPYADKKKGMRATTIKDARKLGLVPSVTTVLGVLDKPGLQVWLQDRVLESALTLTRFKDEPDKQFIARIKKDSKEISKLAMQTGTDIHDAVECAFKNDVLQLKWVGVGEKVKTEIIARYGKEWNIERSFGTDEYGGKIDLDKHNLVIDHKTKEVLKPKMAYDEHLVQLVAYGQGLGYELLETRYVNVFISWEGDIVFHEWEDVDEIIRAWNMFKSCLRLWQLKNRYKGDGTEKEKRVTVEFL